MSFFLEITVHLQILQGASKLVGNAGVGLQVKVLTTMSVKNAKLQVLYLLSCVWMCLCGSVVDPASMGSLDPYPHPDSQSESGSKRAKMAQKNRKQSILDIFYGGLMISKLQFWSKKEKKKNFSCIFFFNAWSSKFWIRIRIIVYFSHVSKIGGWASW